jgi:hypothetical protein
MSFAAGIYCVAAATRIAYLAIFRPSLEGPYLTVADNLLGASTAGAGLSTRFEPGYPMLLAAGRLLFGDQLVAIQLLQILVAAAGAPLVHRLTLSLTGSPRAATLSALMFAIHPLLVRQAAAASDLALTSMLLVAFSLAFVGVRDLRGAAIAGLWIGLSVLTRSMTLPVLVIATAILVARRQHAFALVLTAAAAALIVPMAARNHALAGVPWPTRSGVNLYIGNSQHTRSLLPTYDLDLLEVEAYERFVRARPDVDPELHDENAEFDAFLTLEALKHMAANPVGELWRKILNVGYLLSSRLVPFHVSGPDTRVIIENDAARCRQRCASANPDLVACRGGRRAACRDGCRRLSEAQTAVAGCSDVGSGGDVHRHECVVRACHSLHGADAVRDDLLYGGGAGTASRARVQQERRS